MHANVEQFTLQLTPLTLVVWVVTHWDFKGNDFMYCWRWKMPLNIKLHEGQAQKQVDDILRSYSAHVCVIFLVWNHFLGLQETNIGLGTIINMQLTPWAIYFRVIKTTSLHP